MMKKITLILILLSISLGYSQATHNVDFETAGVGASWAWTMDQNGTNPALEFIANPVSGGLNTSATVAKFTATFDGDVNAKPWALTFTDDNETFTFDAINSTVKIMVYKPTISDVAIKFEGASPDIQLIVANTVINQWEELTFDFSSVEGNSYKRLVIIPDFEARAQENIVYFDNIKVPEGEVVVAPVGPVSFTVTHPTAAGIRMTGPWWSWDPIGGPIAVDNGNGTWTVDGFFAGGADQESFEYLWVETNAAGDATAGAGQENLVDNAAGGECADRVATGNMVTDNANYANRVFTVGPTTQYETFDDCSAASLLSVNDYEIEGLTAYPNPTTNKWRVSTLNEEMRSVEIFNTLGKRVLLLEPNDRVVDINAESLVTGIYLTKISTDSGSSTRRLIKN